MIAIYVIVCYLITGGAVLSSYFSEPDGEITYADVIMIILAPFAAVPVAAVFIMSRFIDLDEPFIKK
jgi:hypothetical protein